MMRYGALAGVVLMSVTLGGSVALAQNYNAADAVSLSRYGAMSCAQFTHLSGGAQANIVRKMVRSAPPTSLSTPMPPSINPETGAVPGTHDNGSAVPGTPLSAGQLVAACQAVSPSSSLKSAFARFNSSTGVLPPPPR